MAGKGAEIRAGIVVLMGLTVLAIGLFLVSGGAEQFMDKKKLTILFQDAGGIASGDSVKLAGQKIGEVVDLRDTEIAKEGVTRRYVAVTIEVFADKDIQLDSQFIISQTITGIVSMDIYYGVGAAADASAELHGMKRATFEEAIGETKTLLDDAKEVVAEVKRAMENVTAITAEFRDKHLPAEAQRLLASLNDAATEAKGIIERAKAPIGETLADLRGSAANVKDLTGDVKESWPEMEKKLQTILDRIRDASDSLNSILEENRPDIRAVVQNIKDASLRIAPTLERVETLMKTADETVVTIRPKLVSTLENARQAMANFAAVTQDLKTAPWKLVNKPSDQEAREVHLYNAAQLYIAAAEQVKSQIDELDTLRRLGAMSDDSQKAAVDETIERLRQSLRDYDSREKDLVALMVGGAGTK